MIKRVLFILVLAIPAFAQTPCIEQAKLGVVGPCLGATVTVTGADAQYVPTGAAKPGYLVDPQLPQATAMQFATKEQALAIIELIKFAAPGSVLTLGDVGSNFFFPPFRQLKYFNAGDMFDPRVYEITGTIPTANGPQLTIVNPGWFINVNRIINGGRYFRQLDKVVIIEQFGGAFPKWELSKPLESDGPVR